MEYYAIQPVYVGNPLPDEIVEATGGVVTDYTDDDGAKWREHDFLSTDFLSSTAPGAVEFWLVAAGGGGGGASGAGGGGGGYLHLKDVYLPVGIHAVEIGAGGARGARGSSSTDATRHAKRGSNSSFLGFSVNGGGGGQGGASVGPTYSNGGSGGGQGSHFNGPPASPGSSDPYRGHDGGASTDTFLSGGGGGASTPGEDGVNAVSGSGGEGVIISSPDGDIHLAFGGTGGGNEKSGHSMGTPPVGGSDIGEDGAASSGNGGGGAASLWDGVNVTSVDAGNGGSGRVIIRYRIA